MLRRTNERWSMPRTGGRAEGRGRRQRNNILGGEGKEENDGAKLRALKRGERRSRRRARAGRGGIPACFLRENTRCEAYDVVKTPTFFYRWKERESGGAAMQSQSMSKVGRRSSESVAFVCI